MCPSFDEPGGMPERSVAVKSATTVFWDFYRGLGPAAVGQGHRQTAYRFEGDRGRELDVSPLSIPGPKADELARRVLWRGCGQSALLRSAISSLKA